ncbi:hypothetical protein [Azospirillum doebereinerae]|uniref:Uncharacterized protein n=1 Tax=Azospirillum doebereinerae TaxID=92933 RepID=A0A3S0UY99_9PROT|nr:hypothetical protein [Azospirillum doebereinerae]RUQ64003.1 hypothetical protein EJ913_27150 [Azospirillum doebereinerae]
MFTAVPLLPILLAYQGLAPVDAEATDTLRGNLEQLLAEGEVASDDDLFAKARYIQDTARLDPALIPIEAIDTLVAGILRLRGPAPSQPAPPLAVAA